MGELVGSKLGRERGRLIIEGPPASAADPPPLQLRLCIFPVFVVFVVASFGRCFAHTVGMGDRRHETQLFEHNVHFVWHARQ